MLLVDWLERIKKQHRVSMDMGLERVKQVGKALDLLKPSYAVIIVGGTNGQRLDSRGVRGDVPCGRV